MDTSQSPDIFTIERHGEITVIIASPALETIDASLEQQVSDLMIRPLSRQDVPMIIFDLAEVNYFGSMFLGVMLRCWKLTTSRGGSIALAGVSQQAKELLRLTSLDMIWAIYPTRQEAMEALLAD